MERKIFHLLLFAWMIGGCGVQVSNEAQSGRAALQGGNPESAISSFRHAADSQPDYVVDTPPLRQSIWTYLGRAYYESGKLREAREALSQALQRDDRDFLARLYWGLILFREAPPRLEKPNNSLGLNDILYALKERISSKRVAGLIQERGVNFSLTAEAEKELRKASADEELLTQIRSSLKAAAKATQVSASPSVVEIERALTDTQAWQVSIRKGDFARAWDPRGRLDAQVKASRNLIASGRTDRQEFIPGLESIGRIVEEEVDLVRSRKK